MLHLIYEPLPFVHLKLSSLLEQGTIAEYLSLVDYLQYGLIEMLLS
jgi:hypothetical protein